MRLLELTNAAISLSALVSTDFDYFKLAEFHDGLSYTLHGVWPSRFQPDSWPEFCPGPRFNETALRPLKARLERDWPNEWGSAAALHRHEYQRHGVCSNLSEYEYFKHSLDAYEMFNLNKILPPSAKPPMAERLQALFYDKYNVHMGVEHKRHGRARDVFICLDKGWKLIDCPQKPFFLTI